MELSASDAAKLVVMCNSVGLKAVLVALSERCAAEGQAASGEDAQRWGEAFRALRWAATTVEGLPLTFPS